jgi:hypothetical protein
MVRRGLRQVIAQEKADGNRIAATLGNPALAGNILKKTDHEHFEIDGRIHGWPPPPVVGIGRGAEFSDLFANLEGI